MSRSTQVPYSQCPSEWLTGVTYQFSEVLGNVFVFPPIQTCTFVYIMYTDMILETSKTENLELIPHAKCEAYYWRYFPIALSDGSTLANIWTEFHEYGRSFNPFLSGFYKASPDVQK